MDLVALCIWRESRSEGPSGMKGVACVIANRAIRHHQTPAEVVMVPWAFSSMTAHGDPQLVVYPKPNDPQFALCQQLSAQLGKIGWMDITKGATLYYDNSISFPKSWNAAKCVFTVQIGRLLFYKEIP